jgi:hypothetical protein
MSNAKYYKGSKIETVAQDDLIKYLYEYFASPDVASFSKIKVTKTMITDILKEIDKFILLSLAEKNVKLFGVKYYQFVKNPRSARTQTVPGKEDAVKISAKPAEIGIKCKPTTDLKSLKLNTKDFGTKKK